MTQNVLVIGGSRNIGYFSAIRFLDTGATVTFLLRSPSVFDKDEVIQGHIKSGKAHIVKGDALIESDVQQSWNEAGKHGNIDLLLFTVGGTPKFHPVKGFIITPENLVTQSLINVLCTMPRTTPEPKLITISSAGVTRASHTALPLLLKPVYGYLLAVPHKDKVGAERVISHCAGWTWKSSEDGEPDENIMGPGDWTQRSGLPAAGTLKKVLVIRPALLTDGECVAEGSGKSYRVSDGELKGWTVSRKDVAHFVVDAALNRWREFENKVVSIAY
ncbi:hypothetical protein BDZ94DRAFT_1165227 [Collybia nuda]|uniref:NAD(P)-binding domain-containing protein n=1 Tax=Collybia nuda TaxID=64659 RepID=A0A9P5Y7T0_9AGAR|nr:hypothetical protein BDZ94DRAFT_1165227 [Collybia nuda]